MESNRTLNKMMISEIGKVNETQGDCQGVNTKNTIAERLENR